MAVLLDTDTYKVTKRTAKKRKINTKELQFGDGYRQILVDGINYDREQWSMDFVLLDSTSAIALEEILVNSVYAPANIIQWTPLDSTTAKYWTAGEVSKTPNGISGRCQWKITCTLSREYPLTV